MGLFRKKSGGEEAPAPVPRASNRTVAEVIADTWSGFGPRPQFDGGDGNARRDLERLSKRLEAINEEYGRPYDERQAARDSIAPDVAAVARRLERARDPRAGRAWLTHAEAIRYAKGRRDEVLTSYLRACWVDPRFEPAVFNFVSYISGSRNDPPLDAMLALCEALPADSRGAYVRIFNGCIPKGTKAMPVLITPELTRYAVGIAELYEGDDRTLIEKRYRAAVNTNVPRAKKAAPPQEGTVRP